MVDLVATFVMFFAVIDPIGTIPVFIAVTNRHAPQERARIAGRATLISAAILLLFVVVGEILLTVMGIPLAAFQVAGGIILFLFALSMIFGESKPDEELRLSDSADETAVFPLAVPSIASPGAMLTAVLLTENDRFTIWEQVQTASVMLAVLLVTFVLMRLAGGIHRVIGSSGASVVSRVMGFILGSVAMNNVLGGIEAYFAIPAAAGSP